MPQETFRPETVAEPWTCPSCETAVYTSYCPACGEQPPHPRDLTLRGLIDQVVAAFTSIDGRLIRSLRCLVAHLGSLTVAYLRGQRKLYSPPLQLFFLANVLFFALHTPTGAKVFSAPLDSHLHSQPWGDIAQRLITHHLETAHTTLELYAPVFDSAVALNAKSLIVLMVLPFALLPPLLFSGSKRPFVVHIVFSLHFFALLLLLFCVALVVMSADQILGGAGAKSQILDDSMTFSLLLACAIYLYLAIGPVYAAHGGMRALKTVALTVAVASAVLGYRFALLLITLYGT